MSPKIIESMRLENGTILNPPADDPGLKMSAQFYHILMTSAERLTEAAGLGRLFSFAGYDSSGGFLIERTGPIDQVTRVSETSGWSFSNREFDAENPVTNHFCSFARSGEFEPFVESNLFLLPLETHLRLLSKIEGFGGVAIRSERSIWKHLLESSSDTISEGVLNQAYGCLKMVFSQKIPRSRLLFQATNGILCAWRTFDRKCVIILFKDFDLSKRALIASSTEGLIMNFGLKAS